MDRSAVAADTLVLALAAIFPCWLFGLEQLGSPIILMLGLLVILFGGCRLKVPVTAWVFLVTLLLTLLSLSRLVDLRSIVLFFHGHFNLTTGLVALVLAANAGSTRVGLDKVLKGFVVFTLMVTAMVLAYALGWLPAAFEVPFQGIFGDALKESEYFRGNILLRNVAIRENPIAGIELSRVSAIFLHPTLMGAAMLPLLTISQTALVTLPRKWRAFCWLATAGAVLCTLASGGRTALLLACTLLGAVGMWRLLCRRRGQALMITILAMMVVGALVFLLLPVGDSAMAEQLLVEFRTKSLQGRADVYYESFLQLGEKPILGWGIQELASRAGWTYLRLGTHSELLNMAYRFGLLGLMAYLVIGGVFGIWYVDRIGHLRRARDEVTRVDMMVLMGIGLVVVALNSLIHMMQWDVNVYWLSVSLAGLVHAVGGGRGPLANVAIHSRGAK